MNPHEKFMAFMRFENNDQIPLWEWRPWPSTLRRWQREGLGEGNSPTHLDECDNPTQCGVDLWMLPRYSEEVLAEDDRYITTRTERGTVQRRLKSPDVMSMPEHIEFPVKNRSDWQALARSFDPSHPKRFPADWETRCSTWRAEGPVLIFQGPRSPSFFGFVRELMGPELALYTFYDDPSLIHEMMETYTEMVLSMLPKVLKEAPLTSIFFWEDMCYKSGSLISPAMFREFMMPRYRRITDLARSLGCDIIFVDSDGNVSELIPLWLESGINGIYPLEVAAGMNVGNLRKEYGRDLLMTGGFDKRVLATGRDAIDAELERTMAVARKGGYIPHLDHLIPHNVPYESFVYYWKRKKELIGA